MDKKRNLLTINFVTNDAKYSWHTGIGRGWPLNLEEENLFRKQLGGQPKTNAAYKDFKRSDISTLVVALREGATVWQLQSFLPGWEPAIAAQIYDSLNNDLKKTRKNWNLFLKNPSIVRLDKLIKDCEYMLPTPVGEIIYTAAGSSGYDIDTAIEKIKLLMHMAEKNVEDLEHKVTTYSTYNPEKAAMYGASLYSPLDPCAYADPYFFPTRVTQITPARLEGILNYRKK